MQEHDHDPQSDDTGSDEGHVIQPVGVFLVTVKTGSCQDQKGTNGAHTQPCDSRCRPETRRLNGYRNERDSQREPREVCFPYLGGSVV